MAIAVETLNAVQLKKSIDDGSRTTLGTGDAVTFTNLPNQPVAIVAYNNTGNTTSFNVVYNNQAPTSYQIDSVQSQGFSLGLAYLINPGVTHASEITVSVPKTEQQGSSIDVYAVSLYFPLGKIQNQEIPLDGRAVHFNGYSRSYATPPLAWYALTVQSGNTGQVGLYFSGNRIDVIAVNTPNEIKEVLRTKVIATSGSGIASADFDILVNPGNSYAKNFYGVSSQLVYSPISAANTTQDGSISIQKIS
ncbi:hypothetical protein [Dickeya fangzhongdai]|uniref:hypothetical protein n=1 Tax=Dickeya fangzhongdai TaxID=1778540 RepID=UPI0006763684|nr:hypothetical protein [Dickeya fangzhongdai]